MSEEDRTEPEKLPIETGKAEYEVGYGKPPVETRFKEGNPGGGRPANAGSSVIEWQNSFATQGLTEKQLRTIARNKEETWNRRTAANQMLRTMEAPDITDFGGVLSGEHQLEDLRAMGVNTEVVKKFKQKTRRVAVAGGGQGEVEEIIDREIEFYDRAGENFDRTLNHTNGTPIQTVRADVHNTGDTSSTEGAKIIAEALKSGKDDGDTD